MTALAGELGRPAIIAVSAVGYLLVLLVEAVLWRGQPGRRVVPKPSMPEAEPVVVAAERAPEPEVEPAPGPPVEPEAEVEPEPEAEPTRALRPVPDLEPELAPVPEPEPLAPEPAGAAVVPIGVSTLPRQWNLWDLERLTREASGRNPIRDEERSYLLMYLRDFAGPDGELPIDFDGLVRDSFGELVGAR